MKKISQQEMQRRKKSLVQVQNLERHKIIIILENIRSAYNVGALFRTADGALVEKIVLIGCTPVPPSTHIDKAALGATDSVPWEYFSTTGEAVHKFRAGGYQIVALEQTDESISYFDAPYTKKNASPLVLIVGNEVVGVDQGTLNLCDYSVDIPMYGRANSLNVATAGGILIYDILKHLVGSKIHKT